MALELVMDLSVLSVGALLVRRLMVIDSHVDEVSCRRCWTRRPNADLIDHMLRLRGVCIDWRLTPLLNTLSTFFPLPAPVSSDPIHPRLLSWPINSRPAFTAILETVRSIPFPIPRAFFRAGGGPHVSLFAFPPAPAPANASSALDGGGIHEGGDITSQSPVPGSSSSTGKRSRDGGLGGPRYHGPSCQLRVDMAEEDLKRRPPLPLMGSTTVLSRGAAKPASAPLPADGKDPVAKPAAEGRAVGANSVGRDPWLPSEMWWAQVARDEACAMEGRGRSSGVSLGASRAHPSQTVLAPGVWLLQGSVCRGRGASGSLPRVSEVRPMASSFVNTGVILYRLAA